ncbi:hypothetical protein O181_033972 [Austropuccinia psidii MF-1]|uniref:Uncharacterized protein n=1 Tax=Austropuccinia psidii MF-1 TaxID=1389203 RepID=A0A9Q3D2D4_9BASI|nr:hypothetical protein [Austropuccinia psidii MF-1]
MRNRAAKSRASLFTFGAFFIYRGEDCSLGSLANDATRRPIATFDEEKLIWSSSDALSKRLNDRAGRSDNKSGELGANRPYQDFQKAELWVTSTTAAAVDAGGFVLLCAAQLKPTSPVIELAQGASRWKFITAQEPNIYHPRV